ncbi:MAG: GTP-binding protein [Deltaproteobacteria bacterium]|jgi:bifunctional enzyme CysN/CysC|nr:GTP-binding protein [Deltaproteobacteria bacterium]
MNDKVKKDMNITIVGHVDHGKSTIIGRMLVDTGSLPEGKLEQVKETCRRNSKPFEYAFLLDALKDEQAQGITIDTARCFFKTEQRDYIILDAPGHIEFLKNMVTGASRAEAGFLVIDAKEGIQENSRRHGYMLSMLGIKQISVLVNKMDLVDYSKEVFTKIRKEFTKFLNDIKVKPKSFLPVSGMEGDNIASSSPNLSWYKGKTVLEQLDAFKAEKFPENKAFRMPVQGVYKFTKGGDDRRIVSGTITSGRIKQGDEVIFYPSGKKSRVETIEAFNRKNPKMVKVGQATGFILDKQIYIKRGDIATLANQEPPKVTSRIKTNIFWLGQKPMEMNKDYLFKLGTAKIRVRLESIIRVIDASDLSNSEKDQINRHDVAECILKLERAAAFDLTTEIAETSRFVLVDDYEISGGGIVDGALPDQQSWVRKQVYLRNTKWQKSVITSRQRAEKYNQKACLILVTGQPDVGKKPLAKFLEKKLFDDGKIVYFLGMGNLLYGVDADLKNNKDEENPNNKQEHIRRLAEVSNIMLDAGAILIVTAIGLEQEDVNLIETSVDHDNILCVWLGKNVTTDIKYDLHLPAALDHQHAANQIKYMLQKRNLIFTP